MNSLVMFGSEQVRFKKKHVALSDYKTSPLEGNTCMSRHAFIVIINIIYRNEPR